MSKESLNDEAWGKLFDKYNILEKIDSQGQYEISANQIKEYREPRLMAKFDHTINLPKLFSDNKLAILPVTRGNYVISHFNAYHKFETGNVPIKNVSLPTYIQSLDCSKISSESVALNCALVSEILSDFLEDTALVPTVSGRMSSGVFDFNIESSVGKAPCSIKVNNSQIEIDAAYEGLNNLTLFEAKCDLSDDFLIRQLYYPYRVLQTRVIKSVRSVFLVYSNGIYRLYEYAFENPNNYSSICLIKQKHYSIEDTAISVADIEDVLHKAVVIAEPAISFPQANSFERVINLCELLREQELSRSDVTKQYDFDERQTNYYTDAGRYLGLIEKRRANGLIEYYLTDSGKRILNLNFKQRQIEFCKLILAHKPFHETLKNYLSNGVIPSDKDIVKIMQASNLFRVRKDSTFERRASTIKNWVNWMIGLINDD